MLEKTKAVKWNPGFYSHRPVGGAAVSAAYNNIVFLEWNVVLALRGAKQIEKKRGLFCAQHRVKIGASKMQPYVEKFLLAFIPLFVAIDPIGLVAIFLGLGGHADATRKRHEGMLALVTSLAVSVGFIFLGKIIFRALGITVADFQVAGGLILLGIAVRELLDLSGHNRYAGEAFGVVPLGMPLIAGPALLTALLILVDTVGILFTILALLVNLMLVGLGFRYAHHFTRWMGQQGMRGVSKLISLLLAAIAVSLIRRGWLTP